MACGAPGGKLVAEKLPNEPETPLHGANLLFARRSTPAHSGTNSALDPNFETHVDGIFGIRSIVSPFG